MAKDHLLDPVRREKYNNALEVYGLADGQQKDPNFEATLKARQNKAPTEVLTPTAINMAPVEAD